MIRILEFDTIDEVVEYKSRIGNQTTDYATIPYEDILLREAQDKLDEFEDEQIVFELKTEGGQLEMECVHPHGMDEILAEFGIKVTHSESGGSPSSGVIGCKKEIQQIYEKLGDKKFYDLIYVETHAWPKGGYKRWNKFILRDLAVFIDIYYDTENYDRQILICHISKQVRKDIPITPDDFLEMIDIYEKPGAATEKLYSNGFQKKNKLTKIRGNIL